MAPIRSAYTAEVIACKSLGLYMGVLNLKPQYFLLRHGSFRKSGRNSRALITRTPTKRTPIYGNSRMALLQSGHRYSRQSTATSSLPSFISPRARKIGAHWGFASKGTEVRAASLDDTLAIPKTCPSPKTSPKSLCCRIHVGLGPFPPPHATFAPAHHSGPTLLLHAKLSINKPLHY